MKRFQISAQQKKGRDLSASNILVTLFILIVVLAVFSAGLSSVEKSTTDRQKTSLENAVKTDITYCYATEGRYPDSVEYIEKNYGLTYDKNKFYVGYQYQGSNILPDVTIVQLETE